MEDLIIKEYYEDISNVNIVDFYNVLPMNMRSHVDRYRMEDDKARSILGAFLLHNGLKELGYENEDSYIVFDEDGKGHLRENTGLHYSISHSGNKAYVVISNKNIGCDIEKVKDVNMKIADKFFNKDEVKLIGNNKETFIQVWTIKEAYLKLVGKGLLMPLNSICVNPDFKTIKNHPELTVKSVNEGDYIRTLIY